MFNDIIMELKKKGSTTTYYFICPGNRAISNLLEPSQHKSEPKVEEILRTELASYLVQSKNFFNFRFTVHT